MLNGSGGYPAQRSLRQVKNLFQLWFGIDTTRLKREI
jgi:hypothetical protein